MVPYFRRPSAVRRRSLTIRILIVFQRYERPTASLHNFIPRCFAPTRVASESFGHRVSVVSDVHRAMLPGWNLSQQNSAFVAPSTSAPHSHAHSSLSLRHIENVSAAYSNHQLVNELIEKERRAANSKSSRFSWSLASPSSVQKPRINVWPGPLTVQSHQRSGPYRPKLSGLSRDGRVWRLAKV